jgi:hypothetical protein
LGPETINGIEKRDDFANNEIKGSRRITIKYARHTNFSEKAKEKLYFERRFDHHEDDYWQAGGAAPPARAVCSDHEHEEPRDVRKMLWLVFSQRRGGHR